MQINHPPKCWQHQEYRAYTLPRSPDDGDRIRQPDPIIYPEPAVWIEYLYYNLGNSIYIINYEDPAESRFFTNKKKKGF